MIRNGSLKNIGLHNSILSCFACCLLSLLLLLLTMLLVLPYFYLSVHHYRAHKQNTNTISAIQSRSHSFHSCILLLFLLLRCLLLFSVMLLFVTRLILCDDGAGTKAHTHKHTHMRSSTRALAHRQT